MVGLLVDGHLFDFTGLIIVDIGPQGFIEELNGGSSKIGNGFSIRILHGGYQILSDAAPQAGTENDGSQHQYQDDG